MRKERMLWDRDKMACIKASLIKELRIGVDPLSEKDLYLVKGWLNANDYFYFGSFSTTEKAQDFIKKLIKQIEGGG